MYIDPKNFIGCKHNRKEKYGIFNRCADCKYHFCYDDTKYSHPNQYKDCKHPEKGDIFGDLTCLRCGLRFTKIFSTCEHRRKKRFFDYSDFYCCADCDYHFVDGDPKYRHPNQYENCEHTDQRMVDNQLVCSRCGLRFTGPPPIPFVKGEKTKCKHTRLENMYGTVFCTNCGLVDEYIPYDDTCKHPHLAEKNDNTFCTNCGLFEEYESINDLCVDLSYHARIQENKTNLNEHSKVKDLREAATKAGVKRVTVMSKKQLCKVLVIKNSNEGKYILKNLKTGEEHRLKNQKEISDKFGICQGSLSFLLKKGKATVNGNTYSLKKL